MSQRVPTSPSIERRALPVIVRCRCVFHPFLIMQKLPACVGENCNIIIYVVCPLRMRCFDFDLRVPMIDASAERYCVLPDTKKLFVCFVLDVEILRSPPFKFKILMHPYIIVCILNIYSTCVITHYNTCLRITPVIYCMKGKIEIYCLALHIHMMLMVVRIATAKWIQSVYLQNHTCRLSLIQDRLTVLRHQ